MYMCGHTHAKVWMWRSEDSCGFSLSTVWLRGMHSGHQSWQQVPLPTEPFTGFLSSSDYPMSYIPPKTRTLWKHATFKSILNEDDLLEFLPQTRTTIWIIRQKYPKVAGQTQILYPVTNICVSGWVLQYHGEENMSRYQQPSGDADGLSLDILMIQTKGLSEWNVAK